MLQQSFVRALLLEELAVGNRWQAHTVYQVRPRAACINGLQRISRKQHLPCQSFVGLADTAHKVPTAGWTRASLKVQHASCAADTGCTMLAVRQPACLLLVADTLGERAEAVCAAHHGHLTFRLLAQLLTTPVDHEPGGTCGGSVNVLPDLAASVAQLLSSGL